MKSMTAYAQVVLTLKSHRFRLELQSLNKKGLDIQTDLPSGFSHLNIPLRLYLASQIERGSLFLRLKKEADEGLSGQDLTVLKQNLQKLAIKAGFSPDVVSFTMLLDKAEILQPEEYSMDELEPYMKKAIEDLTAMKLKEGQNLKKDFIERFALIVKTLDKIAHLQEGMPAKIKQKLLERLKQLELNGHDEERVAKEVVFYLEKQDVTEELTRLRSHLKQMTALLETSDSCGRKLEFLVQECTREVNTLGAKAAELEVINLTLVLKAEFEKIKEQVMNIE